MPKVTQDLVDQAHGIRTTFEGHAERARNDRTLSKVGRAQKVAAAWRQAQTSMDGLRSNFQSDATLTAADVRQQVFGAKAVTGADAVSMRDAYDRASQVQSPADAGALLARAEMTGDTHLARAVAATAYDNAVTTPAFLGGGDAWTGVLNQYMSTRPDVADQLQRLNDATQDGNKNALDLAGYTYLMKPDELNRVSEYQIDLLANDDDPWNPTNPHPHTVGSTAAVGRSFA